MIFLKKIQEFKNYLYKKENIFYLIVVIIIFSLDRFSKISVLNNFNDNTYYINSFINFDLIWNIGIGFGLLSTDTNIIYSLITVIIALVIIFLLYIFVMSESLDKFIYAIILGGALGNFYDRLVYKAVPDFIDLHYNNFHWFTFNVADIFITLGIIVFVLRSFFIKN
jgi:signal peptidase II